MKPNPFAEHGHAHRQSGPVRGLASNGAGFTLIELLVVIAIIGLLASIVLASLSGSRGKARDAARLSDLHQMQVALELYYNDYGKYPNSCPSRAGNWAGVSGNFGTCTTSGTDGYISGLAPTYIAVLPVDPDGSATKAGYIYRPKDNTFQDYTILAYQTVYDTVTSANRFYRSCALADGNTPHTFAVWMVVCQ